MKNLNIKLSLIIVYLSVFSSGCKKFIEVDAPVTSVTGTNVYAGDATAIAAITSVYARMSNTAFSLNISSLTEMSADNLTLYNLDNISYVPYYKNLLSAKYSSAITVFWNDIYPLIFNVNAALEGVDHSTGLTAPVIKRIKGEAYFLRAYFYFYLVNLYGEVPLVLNTAYVKNSRLGRNSTIEVYTQIAADLNQAKTLLDNQYVDGSLINSTTERVRPNKMAATALLARVYLFMKNYSAAEAASTEVINESTIYSVDIALDQIFLKNSLETIWALQPVKTGFNTDEANTYILTSTGPNTFSRQFYLSADLVENFEMDDLRKVNWIDSVTALGKTYPYVKKYKVRRGAATVTEYSIILRLAEQYLIRSEARAEQNNLQGSEDDINVIRLRAGLPEVIEADQEQLRTAILKERRSELFTEGGHRWLDLKRTGKIDAVMVPATATKGGAWESFKALYPVPLVDILFDNVLTQNPGYN